MSRNTLFIAGLALLLAVGALILQFALPSSGGVSDAELNALQAEVAALRQQGGLKIGYAKIQETFSVFTDAVSDMRQRATDKGTEIVQLQQQFVQSTISRDDFEQELMGLKAEFLDAQFVECVAQRIKQADCDCAAALLGAGRAVDMNQRLAGAVFQLFHLVDQPAGQTHNPVMDQVNAD